MKVPFDRRRTVFIHDLDGVHYPYSDIPDLYGFLGKLGARAAVEVLKNTLTHAEAHEIDIASYKEHGAAHIGFIPRAEALGIDARSFTSVFYAAYHRHVLNVTESEIPKILEKCSETQKLFADLTGYVRHGLVTQAHLEEWALPFLDSVGLLCYFDDKCLLGFEETDHHFKGSSHYPIECAVDAMKAHPSQVVFIEDSLKNLEMAKKRFPEICCALISEDAVDLDYVDVQAPDLKNFFKLAKSTLVPVPQPNGSLRFTA